MYFPGVLCEQGQVLEVNGDPFLSADSGLRGLPENGAFCAGEVHRQIVTARIVQRRHTPPVPTELHLVQSNSERQRIDKVPLTLAVRHIFSVVEVGIYAACQEIGAKGIPDIHAGWKEERRIEGYGSAEGVQAAVAAAGSKTGIQHEVVD